ncbi:hypothetical protein HDU97_005925 [Phlyctochytrium planicorne]|nr:hypothetical protein HDU97_005925 [Phlyctochytrium planicorne]
MARLGLFLVSSLIPTFLAGLGVNAAKERFCGTKEFNAVKGPALEKEFSDLKANVTATPSGAMYQTILNVYFHIIHNTTGDGIKAGNMISEQIKMLNLAFDGVFRFVLADLRSSPSSIQTDQQRDDEIFKNAAPGTYEDRLMKRTLRKGGKGDLNIYSVGFGSSDGAGLLGYSTYPNQYTADPLGDGVVIHYQAMPGGTMKDYNLGFVAAHHVGHWLGLYHTFTGGCGGSGDYVADTPAEESPAYGCPRGRNTCSGDTDKDPINNYMDFTTDNCKVVFTNGQLGRMIAQAKVYRGLVFKWQM